VGSRRTISSGISTDFDAVSDIERYPWPDPEHLDFTGVLNDIRRHSDKAVFTGLWSHFFHIVADMFGMERYFIKMYTHPEVVEAVTEKIVDFYCEANRRFFLELEDSADVFFFGNDLGTQLDLLISPEKFRRFVLPGFRRLINVAKSFDKKVLLHTCGSVYKIIPALIDAGIDGLHPLQARAARMGPEILAREFRRDIAFVGGVDTQELLVRASPAEVRSEVRRLRDVLGPNLVTSPSHEAVLPNIPLCNIEAVAEAAKE
jgi:uroporphyrinogen decarboxylase